MEELSEGASLTKRAPHYPTYMLAQLEKELWRPSSRWADLQAIIPGELSLVEGRKNHSPYMRSWCSSKLGDGSR